MGDFNFYSGGYYSAGYVDKYLNDEKKRHLASFIIDMITRRHSKEQLELLLNQMMDYDERIHEKIIKYFPHCLTFNEEKAIEFVKSIIGLNNIDCSLYMRLPLIFGAKTLEFGFSQKTLFEMFNIAIISNRNSLQYAKYEIANEAEKKSLEFAVAFPYTDHINSLDPESINWPTHMEKPRKQTLIEIFSNNPNVLKHIKHMPEVEPPKIQTKSRYWRHIY